MKQNEEVRDLLVDDDWERVREELTDGNSNQSLHLQLKYVHNEDDYLL
jgi:hypothetical protein